MRPRDDEGRRGALIENLAKNDFQSPLIPQIINNTMYGFTYPALYPNTQFPLNIPIEGNQNEIRFRIWINLDNGPLFQYLTVQNFRKSNRIYKYEVKRGDKVLESQ